MTLAMLLGADLDGMGVDMISAAKRKSLPSSKFALPERNAYPIDTAARVRNAAARLEQARKAGTVSSAEYAKARKRIAAAAKGFGIKSEYNMDLGPSDVHVPSATRRRKPQSIHVRADLAHGGSLHVRHMRELDGEGGIVALEALEIGDFDMLAKDGERVWNQIAKPGYFKGHRAGPFELNDGVFQTLIRNFKALGQPIPVDHEHQSEAPAGELGETGAPAMGFIHDMQVRGGKLYGLVEWNDKGREQVKSGEYRYFSPAIRFNAKHPVTGESIGPVMTSGAMTNSPFLRGMEPLAARDVGNAAGLSRAESMKVHSLDAFLPKMKAALKMNELSSLAECSDQLDRLRDLYEAAPHERAMCQGVNMGDYTDALCSLTEMPVGSNVAQMLDAVQEMIDAAIARHEAAYHEGAEPVENDDEGDDADMRAADAAADTAEGDPTMSAEMLKQLKDTEDKITALTAKFEEQEKAHKVERAELSLALKDSQAKIEKLETELVATKETHAKEKRDARLLEAFETYKDDRKLTDESKEEMALLLDAKPEVFEKRYPRIAADKRHLLRNIASGSKGEKTPTVGGAEAATLSLRDLAKQISRQKGIPLGQAQIEAETILNKTRRAA